MIDISKIRPGDKVTLVPLEVALPGSCAITVTLPRGASFNVTADQIAAHHPAPREFQMGDRVRLKMGGIAGTVRGVDQGEVWVRWDDSLYSPIRLAAHLTLVEAGQ